LPGCAHSPGTSETCESGSLGGRGPASALGSSPHNRPESQTAYEKENRPFLFFKQKIFKKVFKLKKKII